MPKKNGNGNGLRINWEHITGHCLTKMRMFLTCIGVGWSGGLKRG